MNLKELKNEAVQKLNKVINSYGIVIILGIIILLKTLYFYNNTIVIGGNLTYGTIFGTMSFIFVICCFLSILPNRVRVVSSIIVNILLSILLFADHVYYIYSNSILSVAQITNLQYGEQIMSTLPMVVKFSQILYSIDMILFILLLIFKIIHIERKKEFCI